jgi:hypothetical protein
MTAPVAPALGPFLCLLVAADGAAVRIVALDLAISWLMAGTTINEPNDNIRIDGL